MMTNFWYCLLCSLGIILIIMLIMMFRKKTLLDKLNYVFAMNTIIVLLILVVGFKDIALSYSILGFVTSVILAKYIGGHRK